MTRRHVSSKSLRSVGYDQPTQALEVEFNNGGIYRYFEVPVTIFHHLMEAPSKGQYLNAFVRDHYPFSRID